MSRLPPVACCALAAAFAVAACGGPAASPPDAIRSGDGPCATGFNLSIEELHFFLPLSVLPRTTADVAGVATEAVALTELVPAGVLAQIDYGRALTPAQLLPLYDYRLAPESGDGIVIDPDALTSGFLLVSGRTTQLASASDGVVAGLCRIDALRRLVVTRGDTPDDLRQAVIHVADLPTEPFVTQQGAQTTAVSFQSVLDASALLAAGETSAQLDYRLVPTDMLGSSGSGVRFPWAHGHLEELRWVPSIRSTQSLDRTGDLQNDAGATPYGGVAAAGWSTIKALLVVALEPSPDPDHTISCPAGAYTDPASCTGCHEEAGRVDIPVRCAQCHAK